MKTEHVIDKYPQIELIDLYQYLQKNGWERGRVVEGKFVVFNKLYDESEFDVIVPIKKTFKDYNIRMQTTLNILSDLEGIDQETIINRIKKVNMDIIKVRFISSDYEDGSVPLGVANNITHSLYETIVSSASMEENERLKHHRISNYAKIQANNFRFGQTQQGSFIVSLESRIQPKEDQLHLDLNQDYDEELALDPPFQRKIINRINKSLLQLDELNIEDDLFEKSDKNILNINICEALSELEGIAEDLEIEYTFELSERIPLPKGFSNKLKINNNVISKASIISQKFKQIERREEIVADVKVDKVISLDKGGEVYVSFLYSGDDRKHSAKMNLEAGDYIKACKALAEADTKFTVKGVLDKTTRNWIIDEVTSFQECLNNKK